MPNRPSGRPGGRPPRRPPAQDRQKRQERADRHGLGGEQVEGRQAVAELLRARRRRTRDVWLADDLDPAPILDEIVDLATRQHVALRRVARGHLDGAARTDAPQGVIAHADPLPETDFDDLLRPVPQPFLLALDGVTDPQNLGAVLRSAEAAGATGAVLPRHRAVHVTPTVAKAAAGAIERLPLTLVPGLPAAINQAKQAGVWVVGLVTESGQDLFQQRLGDGPVMAVLGSEGAGLSRLVRERCDVLVTIPLRGVLASLNVSAAGAIALFELARQRENH